MACRAFLTVEGVEPGLVTQAWLANHYRWLVWKLAAYEVALPLCFTARQVHDESLLSQTGNLQPIV